MKKFTTAESINKNLYLFILPMLAIFLLSAFTGSATACYCGDGFINTIWEQCEPPYDMEGWENNDNCIQDMSECHEDNNKLGVRDLFGDCNSLCECTFDHFEYMCVEGECGALCDESSDFMVDGSTCYFECDYEENCLYDSSCSLESYCEENVYYYNGECTPEGCVFDSDDCCTHNYHDDYEYYCEGDTIRMHRLFHEFSCTPGGCVESTYYTDDSPVEDCSLQNGWYNYGNDEGPDDPECELREFTCINDDGITFCDFMITESHDYDSQDGSYCIENDEAVEDRDYYCDASGTAQYEASDEHDCGQEAWSGGGDLVDFWDDPECIYTDYFCVDDGFQDFCTSEDTFTDDYDNLDTTECQPCTVWEADHDYYCELEDCDYENPENLCGPGDEWYNPRCSVNCGADCEGDGCCEDSYCSEEYQDFCEGCMLVDWNGNMVMDSMFVEDFAENFCSGMPDCLCSDNAVDCSAEPAGMYCVEGECDAECDEDSDCEPNSCSVEYQDFCQEGGHRLFEYDDDMVLDSTLVEDECENYCEEDCACTCCEPECPEPEINDYCVLGVCDATCDSESDCPAFIEDEICFYENDCQYWCDCGHQAEEYCPEPGTVEQGICYYGTRDCDNSDGCIIETCILDDYQICDPYDGCTDLECVDIEPIMLFHEGELSIEIEFPDGGGSDSSAKIRVPMELQVFTAQNDLTGEPVSFTTDLIHDFALVNDVSGSMDDNCHCADGTPSTNGYCSETQGYPYSEGYPCKIDDLKNASMIFSTAVLSVTGNELGLVSYSTNVDSFIELTDDISLIEGEIETYSAGGFTCISCGIRKGIEILNESNDSRVIILMTDGNANRCFAGVECGGEVAKAEALSEAQRAWDEFGISIVTVAFGEDADTELLQEIANISASQGGYGSYHYALVTDIELVYEELATELTSVYPTDPEMDAGSDGDSEWSYEGEFSTTETAEFASELQELLECTCDGCSEDGDYCIIDLEVYSGTAGFIILDNLLIEGCIYEFPEEEPECYTCSDCSGGESCQEEGPWSEWECEYDSVCDQTGDCSRSREITDWVCMNPGTLDAYCDNSVSEEWEYDTEERETDELPCDDGLWCTVDDMCLEGICSGFPRDCDDQNPLTEDWCSEEEDQCINEATECHDNDGDGHDDIECGGDDPDDDDDTVYPGAPELCDDKDNDCDGEVDEGLTRQCGQTDVGECTFGTEYCEAGEWTGCNAVFPVGEVCRDGKDNDCDGSTDEGCSRGGGGSLCVPIWDCGDWGECQTDGTQSRTCTDLKDCGNNYHIPDLTQDCEYSGNQVAASPACEEDWVCGDWSDCLDSQQARACSDQNECGTEDDKPEEVQSCEEIPAQPGAEGGPPTGFFLLDPVMDLYILAILLIIALIAAATWKARKT